MNVGAGPLRILCSAACLLAALSLLACSGGDDSAQADDGLEVVNYVTRGRVVQVPSPDSPAAQLQIHHEPIPSYMSRGEVVGMNAMVMPFPLAPGVTLEGVAPGDVVELAFSVEYEEGTGVAVNFFATRVTKLPANTPLDLGRMGTPD